MAATTGDSSTETHVWKKALAGISSAVGLGLVSYGAYTHLSLAGRARCDGCDPWHPLFVVAPLVVGSILVLSGGYLLGRS